MLLKALGVLAGCIAGAVAWGAAGHEIVATIAQIHLHPSVFPAICAILNSTAPAPSCHLAPVATWADTARPKMPWSAPLHYIGAVDDYPSQTCAFPGPRGWAGKDSANVLGGIRNVTDILMDWVYFNKGAMVPGYQYDAANEALKFLVHFLGDMHMPLHLTGRDRGGNSIPVFFDGRKTNLHSLWDSLLIAKALRSVPSQYSHPLPLPQIEQALRGTIYDSYVRMIMWEGVLGEWKRQIPDWLSCPVPLPSQAACVSKSDFDTPAWQEALARWNLIGGSDDRVVCPHHWAKSIHALNCGVVWPAALDQPPYNDTRPPAAFVDQQLLSDTDPAPFLELDTPEYSGVISERRIVEKLLAQAGIRLAGVLNYLFADLEDDEQRLSIDF